MSVSNRANDVVYCHNRTSSELYNKLGVELHAIGQSEQGVLHTKISITTRAAIPANFPSPAFSEDEPATPVPPGTSAVASPPSSSLSTCTFARLGAAAIEA